MANINSNSPYKGSGSLTREQFLFYETRVVARLMVDKQLDDKEIVEKIVADNLFQFPTERTVKNIAKVCIKRLHCLEDESLINTIAHSCVENSMPAPISICMFTNSGNVDFTLNTTPRYKEAFNSGSFISESTLHSSVPIVPSR